MPQPPPGLHKPTLVMTASSAGWAARSRSDVRCSMYAVTCKGGETTQSTFDAQVEGNGERPSQEFKAWLSTKRRIGPKSSNVTHAEQVED